MVIVYDSFDWARRVKHPRSLPYETRLLTWCIFACHSWPESDSCARLHLWLSETAHGGIETREAKVHQLKLRSTMMARDDTLAPPGSGYKVIILLSATPLLCPLDDVNLVCMMSCTYILIFLTF
jgi:hypothetical protein